MADCRHQNSVLDEELHFIVEYDVASITYEVPKVGECDRGNVTLTQTRVMILSDKKSETELEEDSTFQHRELAVLSSLDDATDIRE